MLYKTNKCMKAGFILKLLIILICHFSFYLFAQEDLKFERIGTEDGLAGTHVFDILQDHLGFLWIGTLDGLQRYDGYNFKTYRHLPFDSTSISYNEASIVYEDHLGTLWIGTRGNGLNRFDRENEIFIRYKHDWEDPESIRRIEIPFIFEDSQDKLWVGATQSPPGLLNYYDRKTDKLVSFRPVSGKPDDLPSSRILRFFEDTKGDLWIGTNTEAIYRFNLASGTISNFTHELQDVNSISGNYNNIFYEDRDQTIWIGSGCNGLNKYNRETGTFTRYKHNPADPYSLSNDCVRTILEDSHGNFWVGTTYGLNIFDRKRNRFYRYYHDPEDEHSLSENKILKIMEDRSGIIWICTNKGLSKYDPGKTRFSSYDVYPDAPTPEYNKVRSFGETITDTSRIIWVGASPGLYQFQPSSGEIKKYQDNPLLENILDTYKLNTILSDDNFLWLGTEEAGLIQLDLNTHDFVQFQHDPADKSSLNSNVVLNMLIDRQGDFWVGTYQGLHRYDNETGRFNRVLYDHGDSYIPGRYATTVDLLEDRFGRLWAAVRPGGLYLWQEKSSTFINFRNVPGNPNSLGSNWLSSLVEDPDTSSFILWIGSKPGLTRFELKPAADKIDDITVSPNPLFPENYEVNIINYTVKDGLINDVIAGVLPDKHGNLWMSSNQGIIQFQRDAGIKSGDLVFRNYGIADGVRSDEFFRNTGFISSDNEFYFGGVDGFTVFHPDSIEDNPYIPPVVFTQLTHYEVADEKVREISVPGIDVKTEIEFDYRNVFLKVEFAALSYRNTNENQYAFMLEGLNNNWIPLGNKHDVTLSGLKPGKYTLHAKGSNNDGIWNEQAASLKITIHPPWWRTSWAYTLYLLLTIGLFTGLYRYERNRRELKHSLALEQVEAEKFQEMDRLKSRFFANISHEFRTPLTLMVGPAKQMLSGEFRGNVQSQYRMILRNGNRLLRLINQLLDISKLEAGRMKLQASESDIVDFLKKVVSAFESLAAQKKIDLSFQAPEEKLPVFFDHDKLEKVMNNLLSNACKFTDVGGKIGVQLSVISYQLSGNNDQLSVDSDQLSVDNDRLSDKKLITDHCLLITVQDSGIGIAAERLPHIFDRFYQVDDSQTRTQEGSGIGLALARELVELHQGKITVESTQGVGSTFKIILPLGKAHLKAEEIRSNAEFGIGPAPSGNSELLRRDDILASSEAASIDSASQSKNSAFPEAADRIPHSEIVKSPKGQAEIVLIVEDNSDMRQYLKAGLEDRYKILEAVDGEQGIKRAVKAMPDLIISDVMMPKMDGFELCRQLKNDERTSHIPVILLTARVDAESKIEGLETGADDYLAKPFQIRELRIRIINLIEIRRKLWEKFNQKIVVAPREITRNSMDSQFLERAIESIEAHLDEPDFETKALASELGLSRSQLNRKLRALTGQSTHQFIRTLRLNRAAQLLEKHTGNVSEIAYEVGFNSPSHFTQVFREKFGITPTQYAAKHSAN